MKGETEVKGDAALDRGASARVISLGDKDLLFLRQSPGTQRERRTALASLISSVADVQEVADATKAL